MKGAQFNLWKAVVKNSLTTITIKSLKEIGKTLEMQLVYGFIPNNGSLNALIGQRALEQATKIVLRTSNTMKLEDQSNTDKSIQEAIKERATLPIICGFSWNPMLRNGR